MKKNGKKNTGWNDFIYYNAVVHKIYNDHKNQKQFEIERILGEISKTILRLNNETYFNVSKNADIAMAKLFIWCSWSINIRRIC